MLDGMKMRWLSTEQLPYAVITPRCTKREGFSEIKYNHLSFCRMGRHHEEVVRRGGNANKCGVRSSYKLICFEESVCRKPCLQACRSVFRAGYELCFNVQNMFCHDSFLQDTTEFGFDDLLS